VGEPPFFLGASVFFAIKDALGAARAEHLNESFVTEPSPANGSPANGSPAKESPAKDSGYFRLYSPATSERIRMASGDAIAKQAIGKSDAAEFQPKGSF